MIAEFRQRILAGQPLCIRGAGSKDWYGNPPRGEILDTRAHRGIVAYEPTELFVTAKCGTPLAEIEAALAERGQCLAFEPPRFALGSTIGGAIVGGATVGGAVAAGLSGPRRASAGALRDFVLGVRLIDGEARELRFGGQVMKNVAGYDVSRVIAGSLGTLGLILEATLKVLPQPVAETSLRFGMGEAEALRRLNEWAGQPLPIVASAWQDGVLTLRLAGARAAVAAAIAKVAARGTAEAVPALAIMETASSDFWDGLRDQTLPFFAAETLWRLSLPSTVPALGLPGETLVEWGGALRWLKTDAAPETVRAATAAAGGHATLYRAPAALKQRVGTFTPLSASLLKLHKNLKAAFDPKGIFNPGRMYSEI